jgi:hypothetical protein
MKVLGNSGDRPPKALCDELRPLPDGLDRFTGGTNPPGAVDDLPEDVDDLDDLDDLDDVISDRTVDDEG